MLTRSTTSKYPYSGGEEGVNLRTPIDNAQKFKIQTQAEGLRFTDFSLI